MIDKESGETVFIEIKDINNSTLTLEGGAISKRRFNFKAYYTNGCTNIKLY